MAHPASFLVALVTLVGAAAAAVVVPLEWKQNPGPVGIRVSDDESVQVLYGLFGNSSLLGYYVADFGIGTPPQYFPLLIDTGSSIIHVITQGCADRCAKGVPQSYGYAQNQSLTAQDVACGETCACSFCLCTVKGTCGFDISYGGNAGSTGNMLMDTFQLSATPDVTAEVFFGAEMQNVGPLQQQSVLGILGMNQASSSFISQLTAQGLVNASFAMCWESRISGTNGSSYLLLDQPPPAEILAAADAVAGDGMGLEYTPLIRKSNNYYVAIDELSINGTDLGLKDLLTTDNTVLVDSGTTYTLVPTKVYAAIKKQLVDLLGPTEVKLQSQQPSRLCWEHPDLADLTDPTALRRWFPEITFRFAGGANFAAGPENYMFRPTGYGDKTACLSIFPSRLGSFVVGNTIRQRVLSHYDVGRQRMGFVSVTDCEKVAAVWLDWEE